MSALVFPQARGTVKRVVGPWRRTPAFRLSMQGWGSRQRAILTQAAVVQNGNYQFLHTINDQIFAYIFGNRISEIQVSGVAFGTYAGDSPGSCQPNQSGTLDVFPFYQQNRISEGKPPLLVRIGQGGVFRAFLTGMNFEVTDPETMLGQFSFRFHSFPTSQAEHQ